MRGLQEGQGKLQSDLEQMMKDLKGLGINPGEGFGDANKSMGQAGKALGDADGGQAVDRQSNALDALRRGGQDMMKQMQQAMGQEGQTGGPNGQQQQNGRLDPLGRQRCQGRFLRRLQEYRRPKIWISSGRAKFWRKSASASAMR